MSQADMKATTELLLEVLVALSKTSGAYWPRSSAKEATPLMTRLPGR
jgi:hypothetical protein